MGFCHIVACICLAVGESDHSKTQIVSQVQTGTRNFQFNTTLAYLGYISRHWKLTNTQMGKVATAMFILYHVFFGLGYSSVPWVYSAEVSSLGWRTRGAAAATVSTYLSHSNLPR